MAWGEDFVLDAKALEPGAFAEERDEPQGLARAGDAHGLVLDIRDVGDDFWSLHGLDRWKARVGQFYKASKHVREGASSGQGIARRRRRSYEDMIELECRDSITRTLENGDELT